MVVVPNLASKLDSWLYRQPFEGASAQRYASVYRHGFGNLDDRLIHSIRHEFEKAHNVLDVGAGLGHFAAQLAAACPHLFILAVEPSAAFAGTSRAIPWVRAYAEALPVAHNAIDIAVYVSSIRHVRNRHQALRELRRVLAPQGVAYIVELDPSSSCRRIRHHSRQTRSWLSRLTFGPLVVRTAPTLKTMAAIARQAGFGRVAAHADPLQPFYIMRLSQ